VSYFYKPPKNIRSYLTFFFFVYLTSFVLYFIGKIVADFIIVGFFLADADKVLKFVINEYQTSQYWIEVLFPFLLCIPIILIAGIIAYIFNLATIGARLMTGIYIRIASGKIGNLIGLIPLFDFGGDWVVETKAKEEINLSTGRGMYKELVAERGGDIVIFSALLGSFLLVILEKISLISLDPSVFHKVLSVNLNEGDFFAIITGFISIFLLCLYIPSMWILKDGEVKKIIFDEENDIKNVTNVATTYRQGFSLFIGFSGLIGIGNIAVEWVKAHIPNAVSNSSILEYIAVYAYAISFFLIMASIILPGICLTMIRYMKKHEEFILSTRQNLIKNNVAKSGTISFGETSILSDIESSLQVIRNGSSKSE
jgi:hypothetical protein